MKKVLTGLLVACVAVLAAMADGYAPRSYDVATTSRMILPPCKPNTTDEWAATNAYAVGDIIRNFKSNGDKEHFWCVTAGTSDITEPTWTVGYTNDVSESNVVWRLVNETRTYFHVQNIGSSNVFLGFGNDAVTNKGTRLNSGGGSFSMDTAVYRGAVYAISDALSTNEVAVQELP